MNLINALAQTFSVTVFDVAFFLALMAFVLGMYYFTPLRTLYEVAFWWLVWLGVYVLLSVLLVGNDPLGTSGGLLPFGLSVFIVSILVYLVLILAVLFPLYGWLVLTETTNPVLYITQYIFVGSLLFLSFFSVMIYMTEQTYLFRVGTVFVWLRDLDMYRTLVRPSSVFRFVMSHQNIIIPLGAVLMIYKLFLSNLVTAVVLSILYNLSSVWFYKKKEAPNYRVEFHEVGAKNDSHDEEHTTPAEGDHHHH